ncbi:MAG: hypothetical protein ABUS49_02375 [Acidobacteriota bacterium]
MSERLPLWRAILGFAVLGSLVAILLSIAPLYMENYRLGQFLRTLAAEPNAAAVPDDVLRPRILDRARQLELPVRPEDVQITRTAGRARLLTKYKVQKDLVVTHLDLHFHPEATTR